MSIYRQSRSLDETAAFLRTAGFVSFDDAGIARVEEKRSPGEEERLAGIPGAAGLVFGSRFDSPEGLARANW